MVEEKPDTVLDMVKPPPPGIGSAVLAAADALMQKGLLRQQETFQVRCVSGLTDPAPGRPADAAWPHRLRGQDAPNLTHARPRGTPSRGTGR